jgi:hypothetical protein
MLFFQRNPPTQNSDTKLATMAPLTYPGQHHGCTDERNQESGNITLLAQNVNSLRYLHRPSGQPNTPETRSRGTHPFSTAEQDTFLADTLSAAWQLALESQAYFEDDDSTNHTTPTTTTTTTTTTATATTVVATTLGRHYIHKSTDLDHHENTGEIMPKQ